MRNILPLLFLIVAPALLQAQQLTADNELELRKELLRLTNELRASQGLAPLQSDPQLMKAADAHSRYMASSQVLSHEGKGSAKTPADRVEQAGGKHFERIGENILATAAQEFPLKKNAVKALAASMFAQWKNSPPHYANMINGEYRLADFGFAVDLKTNKVYAATVFGTKGAEIPGQLSGNAFGVLKGKENDCDLLIGQLDNVVTNIGNSLIVQDNEILLYYHNVATVQRLIDAPNDGLAVDIILPEQLACGKPNQLDGSPIYDGIMLEPVYRDDLFSRNRAESDFRLITPIGTIPAEYLGKDFSLSLIVIQEGRQCSYSIPIEVPHKSYNLQPVDPIATEPSGIALQQTGIVLSEEVHFDFKRNITSGKADEPGFGQNMPIERIDIISYSSVEGRKENNDRLHHSRAQYMLAQLHTRMRFPDSLVHVTAMENWPQMRFQLKYFEMDDLARQSEDSIKAWLRANRSPLWDSLLFAQRHSTAVIHYKGTADASFSPEEEMTMNLRSAILTKNDRLANKALFDMFHSDEAFQEELLFETVVFEALKNNRALVQNASAVLQKSLHSDGIYKCTEFLDAWVPHISTLPAEAQHNLLGLYTQAALLLLDEWDVPAQRLAKVVHPSKFSETANKLHNQSLLLNFHLAAIHYYGQINDSPGINQSFDFIVKHFKKTKLSAQEEIDLVLFFNGWSRYDLTLELLMAHMEQPDFTEDAAFVLAPVAAAYNRDLSEEQVNRVMEIAHRLNPERWCTFIGENFQLRRYDFAKNKVCASCPQ